MLENLGPKQSIILARLSGGPLERTGVMQGMSGSPVYIDGKLVGAVALTFAFSKDAIAGIRPIREMLAVERQPVSTRPQRAWAPVNEPIQLLSKPQDVMAGGARLIDIATPLNFGGFTRGTRSTTSRRSFANTDWSPCRAFPAVETRRPALATRN